MFEEVASAIPFKLQQNHQNQANSIVHHLLGRGFFQNTVIIEAGSGTGQLGLTLACKLTKDPEFYRRHYQAQNEQAAKFFGQPSL